MDFVPLVFWLVNFLSGIFLIGGKSLVDICARYCRNSMLLWQMLPVLDILCQILPVLGYLLYEVLLVLSILAAGTAGTRYYM